MKLLFVVGLMLVFAGSAEAAEAKKIGTYGNWTAYTYTENDATVCYMAASPSSTAGDYSRRGDVFAMITHRPSEKTTNVFSYLAGYEYKRDAPVTVTIDGAATVLIGAGEVAWTPDDATDRKLTEALRHGKKMTVQGLSSRGTETKDTFSLTGSGSAYAAIGKACGISQ